MKQKRSFIENFSNGFYFKNDKDFISCLNNTCRILDDNKIIYKFSAKCRNPHNKSDLLEFEQIDELIKCEKPFIVEDVTISNEGMFEDKILDFSLKFSTDSFFDGGLRISTEDIGLKSSEYIFSEIKSILAPHMNFWGFLRIGVNPLAVLVKFFVYWKVLLFLYVSAIDFLAFILRLMNKAWVISLTSPLHVSDLSLFSVFSVFFLGLCFPSLILDGDIFKDPKHSMRRIVQFLFYIIVIPAFLSLMGYIFTSFLGAKFSPT